MTELLEGNRLARRIADGLLNFRKRCSSSGYKLVLRARAPIAGKLGFLSYIGLLTELSLVMRLNAY